MKPYYQDEIKFKRDTAFRKQFFVPDSFAHPAKMDAQLLLWIVEHYTETGETILDPMAGSGTTMLACGLGRNVILVELEEKFCKMCRDNWEMVRMRPQLGSQMGECQIIQGDARNLEYMLNKVDKCIFSPPYVTGARGDSRSPFWDKLAEDPSSARYGRRKHPSLGEEYSDSKDNIGNLPYGSIDKIVTSPPFGKCQEGSGLAKNPPKSFRGVLKNFTQKQGDDINNLGNLPYGNIDAVVTSPPYEGSVSASTGGERDQSSARQREARLRGKGYDPAKYQGGIGRNLEVDFQYSKDDENIGNLKSDSYLEAMLQVYQQCHSVLKPQGLMILVVKPFIRNQKLVPLQEDAKQLCDQVGFSFIEEHHRILPSQSFWRVIYAQRFPNAPKIDREYVLVFKKDDEL